MEFGTAAYYREQYIRARQRAQEAEERLEQLRSWVDSDLKGSINDWIRLAQSHEKALERVRGLADFWASMPGSSHGLPANCMTNDCAAFWVHAAIDGSEVTG